MPEMKLDGLVQRFLCIFQVGGVGKWKANRKKARDTQH